MSINPFTTSIVAEGIIGSLVSTDAPNNSFETVEINDPAAAEVWTVKVDTATNDEVYGITLTESATEALYTADATATVGEVASGLADAWNSSPGCYSFGAAVAVTDTVTITGTNAGREFSVALSTNAAKMTATNTADAAVADDVEFGRAIISIDGFNGYTMDGIQAKSSAFTARVITLTPVDAASEHYFVDLTIEGVEYKFDVAQDTNLAGTCTAIAAAINADMPANSVIADGSGGTTVVLTAEVAGKGFTVEVGSTSGAKLSSAVTAGDGASGSLEDAFVGISMYSTGCNEYAGGTGAAVLTKNDIWVEIDSGVTVARKAAVYVELDSTSDDRGRLYTVASATRAMLPKSRAIWLRKSDKSDTAVIRLEE